MANNEMMMSFDMASSNLGNAVNNNMALAPNKIHDVYFQGVELGQSKNGQWTFMKIKFEGVDGGYYNDTTFTFDEKGKARTQSKFGDNPSQLESFMMKVKHLMVAVAPDLLNRLQTGDLVFTPKGKNNSFQQEFIQYISFISEQMKPYIGVKTSIKLVPNNKGVASFPAFFAGVSKAGTVYMKSNFIGANLSFSPKELELIERVSTAKPTVMADTSDNLSLDDEGSTVTTDATDDLLNMDL